MTVKKVLLCWPLYVVLTTAVYALFFNGEFGEGGELPGWLIAASSVLAVAAIALLVYWVRGVTIGRLPRDKAREMAGFFWMIVLTGALGDMLAVFAEIAFGAAAVWLMIPISTLTYALSILWLYHRYYKPKEGDTGGADRDVHCVE